MKKLIYGGLFLALVGIVIVGCQKESLNPDLSTTTQNSEEISLDEDKIVSGFKNSVAHFRKKNVDNKMKSNYLENDYKTNLEYINTQTGLNLNFDNEEIEMVKNSLKGDYLSSGFTLSDEEYLKNIELIKANGDYEVFLEATRIIEDVYSGGNQNSQKAISWGCGLALASNFVATLSLTACVTGVGCPLAIAGKALSLAGVAASC